MKIGIITPTHHRPYLLNRASFYIKRQTLEPSCGFIAPGEESLKEKYRQGLEALKDKVDLIFFMEDDDYYPANYLEKMVELYGWAGKPEIFGIGETWFYHPEFRAYWYYLNQEDNSCAFTTCIRSDAVDKIDWSTIDDVFVDAGLWRQLQGETVTFGKPFAIGIKHGRGKRCLAGGHTKWFYDEKSKLEKGSREYAEYSDTWLREHIGADADFYDEFGKNRGLI